MSWADLRLSLRTDRLLDHDGLIALPHLWKESFELLKTRSQALRAGNQMWCKERLQAAFIGWTVHLLLVPVLTVLGDCCHLSLRNHALSRLGL